MYRKWLFVLTVLLIFGGSNFAAELPQPSGWVNDFAGVISQEYRTKLEDLAQVLEKKTTAEIFVVTVDSIAPYDEKQIARKLFDSWKPGKKGKDNGVLVLLAVRERRWRIETGYGLEGILPDSLCGTIGRNYMVPLFKEGKYGEGLYYGAAAIIRLVARDSGVEISGLKGLPIEKSGTATRGSKIVIYFFAVFFFYLWNLPWPIFIGLPFTLLFAGVFYSIAPLAGILTICSYCASMATRYFIWRNLPLEGRPGLLKLFIFGLPSLGGSGRGHNRGGYYGGGFGGGFGGGGGGFGGGGGGCGGGGGAGGGF
ncbi:MAG: TPM domain-containing protein [Candidatus Omnitrophica bacterium]|nr:TPM domain-containing protein [Candidatus Omnitrophota bacterium]